jgi:hypothetical protein
MYNQIIGNLNMNTYDIIVDKLTGQGLQIVYKPLQYEHGGYVHNTIEKGKEIVLNSNLSKFENVSVLFHELAHVVCGHLDDRKSLDRQIKEIEAESTAYLIAQYYNIEIQSQFYLKGWAGNSKAILSSLNIISKSYKKAITMLGGILDGTDQGHYKEAEFKDLTESECETVCTNLHAVG